MRFVLCCSVLAALAGCYSPFAREGAPCDNSNQCPSPQRCVLGNCSLHDAPPADAPPDPPDAAIDAAIDAPPPPIDAMPLVCEPAGLSCPGGTATTFKCGGNCWGRCTGNVSRETARSLCAAWMGALAQIESPAEQTCVTPMVTATSWIGLTQAPGSTTPGAGWTWNGTVPLVYTNWAAGKPDDGSNGENGAEQCAAIRTNGTWDDDACGTSEDFFCERP